MRASGQAAVLPRAALRGPPSSFVLERGHAPISSRGAAYPEQVTCSWKGSRDRSRLHRP